MTNAEKYLKDGVEVKEIWHKYQEFLMNNDKTENACTFVEFMEEQSKPTLTEDERVILNFIKNFDYIGRDEKGLYYKLQDEDVKGKTAVIYNHTTNLFKFIKERRKIFY